MSYLIMMMTSQTHLTHQKNDNVDDNGVPLYEKLLTDYWIDNEVCLPQGEMITHDKVTWRSKDADGNIIGTYGDNPFINTVVYDVAFPDGIINKYAANIIAENMYASRSRWTLPRHS